MVLVTVVLGIVAAACIVVSIYMFDRYTAVSGVVAALATVLAIVLMSNIVCCLADRAQDARSIAEYHAFVSTLQRARERGADIESAAIQVKIAEWNERIAAARYWNEGWTDSYVVDEFAELPFIE